MFRSTHNTTLMARCERFVSTSPSQH